MPMDIAQPLSPIRYADSLTRCHLYWLPVARFPIPAADRKWIIEALRLLGAFLKEQEMSGPELFLRQDTIKNCFLEPFMNEVLELRPLLGFPRRPGQKLKRAATERDIEEFKQGKTFVLDEFLEYYCYWLLGGDRAASLQKYFGFGGMTVLWLREAAPPPAETKVPKFLVNHPDIKPVLEKYPLEVQLRGAAALRHPFLKKSVEYFGKELSTLKAIENIPFVVPQLTSADFFSVPEEQIQKLFELAGAYVIESPADKGVLVASKLDLAGHLSETVRTLSEAGLMAKSARGR